MVARLKLKGIDGGSHKRWRMWLNSRLREEPYPGLDMLENPAERRNSQETASDKLEEGGDDVKSSWPLCLGLHTCYNGVNKGKQKRELKQIPKNTPQFRLKAATRLHEVGIASNRGSARRGEYVPGPCTHRPSHHESRLYQKSVGQPAREAAA